MDKDTLTFPHLMEVLQEYGEKARNLYQDKLILADKIASGDLLNSCEFIVKQDGQSFSVILSLEEYWKFVEGGAKGTESSPPNAVYPAHFPPVSALMKWIRIKPVIPRPLVNGKLPSQQQLAFLIGRGIEQEGIDPVPAMKETSEEIYREFSRKIQAAFLKDVEGIASLVCNVFSQLNTD